MVKIGSCKQPFEVFQRTANGEELFYSERLEHGTAVIMTAEVHLQMRVAAVGPSGWIVFRTIEKEYDWGDRQFFVFGDDSRPGHEKKKKKKPDAGSSSSSSGSSQRQPPPAAAPPAAAPAAASKKQRVGGSTSSGAGGSQQQPPAQPHGGGGDSSGGDSSGGDDILRADACRRLFERKSGSDRLYRHEVYALLAKHEPVAWASVGTDAQRETATTDPTKLQSGSRPAPVITIAWDRAIGSGFEFEKVRGRGSEDRPTGTWTIELIVRGS